VPQIGIEGGILGRFQVAAVLEKVHIDQIEFGTLAKTPAGSEKTLARPLIARVIIQGEFEFLHDGNGVDDSEVDLSRRQRNKLAILEDEKKV